MDRRITGLHQDEEGDWIAELSCGHSQHVRHRPPFQVRTWVLSDSDRRGRIGSLLACPLCESAELPEDLAFVRRSPEWSQETVPAGLLGSHRLAEGSWGRLIVLSGRLGFSAATEPPINTELAAQMTQAIPPGVEHGLRLIGPVRFAIDFFRVEADDAAGDSSPDPASP